MKKLLTLTAAVLFSVGLWAASEKFPTTIAPLDVDAVATAGEYVFTCSSANITAEAEKASGWIGWTSTQSAYKDYNKSGSATCMGTQTRIPNLKYDAITFYVRNCSGFCMHAWANGSSRSVTLTYAEYPDGTETVKSFTEASSTDCAHSDTIALDVTKTYYIKASNGNSEEIGITYLYLFGPKCTSPANPLVLSSDAAETVYVGDVINLSTTGGNGVGIGVAGTADETLGGYAGLTWTATAGEHTFVASQVAHNGYCAQESELVFNVLEKTPVSAVTIAGPTAAYVSETVTYTATADNASEYVWTINGVDANTNAAEFTYTPSAAGTYNIVCKARNKFNVVSEEEVWITSNQIALVATNAKGQLITYTAVQKSTNTADIAADANNVIGGTVEQKSQTNAKLNTGGYYKLTLAKGLFMAGDTVRIIVTPEGNNFSVPATMIISSVQDNTDIIGQVDGLKATSADNITADIVLTKGAATIWLSRDGTNSSQNPIVVSISVIRPMATKSVVESLTGLSIDGEALDAASLAALQSAHNFGTAVQYVNAPTMVFTKHVVITYEDDSQVESDKEIEVLATDLGDSFEARATINGIEYIISTGKATSFVVTYMDGTTELGTENVETGSAPANYANFQNKDLATFVGWYSDPELENAVDMSAEVITAAKTYYAKFEDAYAQSINIEQLILDNSTSYDILSALDARNYATGIVINSNNALDTLNDLEKKDNRNYAYLGLKVKTSGAKLNFRLANASVVRVKFGAYKTTAVPQVSINGGEYENMTITDGVYEHTASAEELISIKTASGDAVVFKQIMIDKALADITLPAPGAYAIVLGTVTNGTLAATWEGKTDKKVNVPVGATVTLTVTPASGYKVESVTVNANPIDAVAGVYSFLMPAEAVTVSASFIEDSGTAIDETEAGVKAVKVIRNGQLFIEKNGVLYNAQGAIVK